MKLHKPVLVVLKYTQQKRYQQKFNLFGKAFATLVTGELPLPSVARGMGCQFLRFPERAATKVAEELLLSGVHLHVLLQAESASALAAADSALVILVTLMLALMHRQLGL